MEDNLIKPHGKEGKLLPRLVPIGKELEEARKRAATLKKTTITSRETSDCIMIGIGAFTPLSGFMTKADWLGVCREMQTADKTFWPIPITVSTDKDTAGALSPNEETALVDEDTGETIAILKVAEKYSIDKSFECKEVFKTTNIDHPGVAKVMAQKEVNLAGPITVLSEGPYPEQFKGIYMRPRESRDIFIQKGWKTVAALQLRNPMHRSHEYLAKIALETMDGLFIHQLIGKLKEGDIPAETRVKCIDVLVEKYFAKNTVVQGGYPLEMRYAGPREALLHACFRQNYGCSHLIVGRDHAGVGDFYGPFDAQKIFDEIPQGALLCKNLNIDWTFWCKDCGSMASPRTCPHPKESRLMLSGTVVRKTLAEGNDLPQEFSRPEVLNILKDYYQNLEKKVEIKLHGAATGTTL